MQGVYGEGISVELCPIVRITQILKKAYKVDRWAIQRPENTP